MQDRQRGHRKGDKGQALVELTLIIPIILLVVMSVAELGIVFGKMSSLGYSSREGARTGSALARGDFALCTPQNQDPSQVDAVAIAAVQRILRSPDSGIDTADVNQIRIFAADSSGQPIVGTTSTWVYAGPGQGPEIDPGPGVARIDFVATQRAWLPCTRVNSGPNTQSIGVAVTYTHDYVTPLPSLINSFSNGGLTLTLTETTVMALNPTN